MPTLSSNALRQIDADLTSTDEHTRWQAAIALGKFVEDEPELVWPLVTKHGSSDDDDLQMAIACCVLEDVLKLHFAAYFPRVEGLVLGGNHEFAKTFSNCYDFILQDIHPLHARQWRRLKRAARKKFTL